MTAVPPIHSNHPGRSGQLFQIISFCYSQSHTTHICAFGVMRVHAGWGCQQLMYIHANGGQETFIHQVTSKSIKAPHLQQDPLPCSLSFFLPSHHPTPPFHITSVVPFLMGLFRLLLLFSGVSSPAPRTGEGLLKAVSATSPSSRISSNAIVNWARVLTICSMRCPGGGPSKNGTDVVKIKSRQARQ